jgi:hypothetical protein
MPRQPLVEVHARHRRQDGVHLGDLALEEGGLLIIEDQSDLIGLGVAAARPGLFNKVLCGNAHKGAQALVKRTL